MPDIRFNCPKCSQMIDAPEELASQSIECPTCNETIQVPIQSQLASSGKQEDAPKPPPPPPEPAPAPPTLTQAPTQKFDLPPIANSAVASVLTIIATVELIVSPVAALFFADQGRDQNASLVFFSGIISGLILLGFARIIQNTFESSQRLRRLEILVERSYENKRAG